MATTPRPRRARDETLDSALASIGLSWRELKSRSREIVLFGSRAIGGERAGSDWDLLCVGEGVTRRTSRIDLLWTRPDEIARDDWLTSELAGHIAAHGRPLVGAAAWFSRVQPGERAPEIKRRWLVTRLRAWKPSWVLCSARLRRRYARVFRQNLQRHALLAAGLPVPPMPLLDASWASLDDPAAHFDEMARRARVAGKFVLHELRPWTASPAPIVSHENRPKNSVLRPRQFSSPRVGASR